MMDEVEQNADKKANASEADHDGGAAVNGQHAEELAPQRRREIRNQTDPDVLLIRNTEILRGESKIVQLPVARLYDYTILSIPIRVARGKHPGPVLFLSAAIHGDEVNGVEIIKRVMRSSALKQLRGTILAAPIVNVFGFNRGIRYLPDRRDLNRSFPGSKNGSLAARLAYIFTKEVLEKATHGIDLHTGAIHRTNLPQIRGTLDDEEVTRLAHSFGVPVVLNAAPVAGSLREAARARGIPYLLYEGGEALRLEENVIRTGVQGVLRVMNALGMVRTRAGKGKQESYVAQGSYWIRAPHSGMLRARKQLGDRIEEGELLGDISDPFGDRMVQVKARETGIVIGMTLLPVVSNGDALFHIATFDHIQSVEESLEIFEDSMEDSALT